MAQVADMSYTQTEARLRRDIEAARADYDRAQVKFRRTMSAANQCSGQHRKFLMELAADGRNAARDAYTLALKRYNDHLFRRTAASGGA